MTAIRSSARKRVSGIRLCPPPQFFSIHMALCGILAIGMTYVIMAGEIGLSADAIIVAALALNARNEGKQSPARTGGRL